MGVHGDDVVLAIRAALKGQPSIYDGGTCFTQSEVRIYPRPLTDGETPTNTWRNRDGRLEFDCVGRDWFRAFRVTVEALPVDDFKGEYGSDDWVVVEDET